MEDETPGKEELGRDAEESARERLTGEDERGERAPIVRHLSPFGYPVQEQPSQAGNATRQAMPPIARLMRLGIMVESKSA
jgi:hypothetical protein